MGEEGAGEVFNLDFYALESINGLEVNFLRVYWLYYIPGVQGENSCPVEILSTLVDCFFWD